MFFFPLKSIAFFLCLYCLSLVWYCFFANSKSIRWALRSLSYFWAFHLHITALVSVWDIDINREKNLFLLGFFHIPPYLCWILTLCPCLDSSWQVSLPSLYILQRCTGQWGGGSGGRSLYRDTNSVFGSRLVVGSVLFLWSWKSWRLCFRKYILKDITLEFCKIFLWLKRLKHNPRLFIM